MVAELAGLDEVCDEEEQGEGDAEAADDEPEDAEEVVFAAHDGEGCDYDALLALVLVGAEVWLGGLVDVFGVWW